MRVLTWLGGWWRAEETQDGRWRLYEGLPSGRVLRFGPATMVEVGGFLLARGVHPTGDLDQGGP